ncbi:MAG TPA: helix-turn-helix transcriptional regulator [Roseomonas sp.]
MAPPITSPADIDDDRQPLVQAIWRDAGRATAIPPHRHIRGQLLLVASGLLVVQTREGSWVVAAGTAFWIPPGHEHALTIRGEVSGWSAYIGAEACGALSRSMGTAPASGLLREALARCAERQGEGSAAERWVDAVLLDEIAALPFQRAYLPMPAHRQIRAIADAIMLDPADNRPLERLADAAGLSRRTATRRFTAETGLSFSAWRQRLRLLRAMEKLAAGASVTETALDLGYDSPSAFTAMFRRSFGVGPAEYAGRRKPAGRAAPPS